jgi:hypothetical protein
MIRDRWAARSRRPRRWFRPLEVRWRAAAVGRRTLGNQVRLKRGGGGRTIGRHVPCERMVSERFSGAKGNRNGEVLA